MADSVKKYVSYYSNGVRKTVGVFGSIYLVGKYVLERLEEVKDRVMQERLARDNLRRRFQQNQEDISYTILALIPSLAEQITLEINVERVTAELQSFSKTPKTSASMVIIRSSPSESSISPDMDLTGHHENGDDARSDMGPLAHEDAATSLSDSLVSTNSSLLSYSRESYSYADAANNLVNNPSRTKAELWNEVKILTFTRVLTLLYSTTLLSLFTTLQLTLLARSKYIHSVLQLAWEESQSEATSSFSTVSLLAGGLDEMISRLENRLAEGVGVSEKLDRIDEDIERKYLTLSWWILHVGWKDVGERVRKGAEDALDGVSLKSRLGLIDVHRLLSDVRRRVEHEITFEGRERRVDFLSTLLPTTTEMTQRVLTRAGFVPSPPFPSQSTANPFHMESQDPDTQFTSLIEETRQIVTSSDFARTLDICLERSIDILLGDLDRDVYQPQAISSISDSLLTGEEVRIRLAELLPALARWSREVLRVLPNILVDTLTSTHEVSGLSAIVFSRFEDRFR